MPSRFSDALSHKLPVDFQITVYEIATTPTKCPPLFLPPPGKQPVVTTREAKFFAVEHESVLVFAIELLIFKDTTDGDTTIFVSKADSSGYFPHGLGSFVPKDSPNIRLSVFRSIASTAIDYAINCQRESSPKSRITVSLFARSQPQYLFPNSGSNTLKHVLSDRSLIAWWCKTLDPVYQLHAKSSSAKAHLLVPGSDHLHVRKLLPDSPPSAPQWTHGHPYELDPTRDITVREVIPHFPDDPKARFLDELNGEEFEKCTKRSPKWTSITNIDQFWELMSYRQECSAGRSVGFLWLTISGAASDKLKGAALEPDITTEPLEAASASSQEKPSSSPDGSVTRPLASARKRSVSNCSPLLSPRKKSRTLDPHGFPCQHSGPDRVSSIILDDKRYKRVVESLILHSDFGTLGKAKASSRKWIDGAYALAHGPPVEGGECHAWGDVVQGTIKVADLSTLEANMAHRGATVESKVPPVNLLGSGLIRKKKKGT